MSNNKDEIILEIPDIPESIKNAIDNNNLAIFIGAGISRLIGCQDWHSLAVDLVKLCYEKKYLTFNEYDTLLKDTDSKRLISISYGLLKDKDEKEFYKKLRNSFKPSPSKIKKNNIYEKIYHMGTTFVTTNADKCFDTIFGKNSPNVICDFKKNPVIPENHRLYHIHGSISDKKTLVFTTAEYLRQYQDKNYKQFLQSLFRDYVVLFIGYGLSEFELLDFLVLKSRNSYDKLEPKHFALMPYFSYERKIANYYDLYFRELNIQTIPFAKDSNGYQQLENVIDAWQEQIQNTTFLLSNTIEDLRIIIKNNVLSNDDIDKIIQLIEHSDVVFKEFIKLCDKNKYITNNLIVPLYEKGYFSPDKNKPPEESKESLGSFRIPRWEMMDFLEAYLIYVHDTNDKVHFSVFKQIVLENIENTTGSRIENFQTDNSLVKFIFSFNEEDITDKCIDFLNLALHSKWNSFVISETVVEKVLPKIITFSDLKKIKRIATMIFSFDYIDSFRIKSLIEDYYLSVIFEKFFLEIYKRLDINFIDVFEKIISELKLEKLYFIQYNFSKTLSPRIDDIDYIQTLVNCYIWLALQQKNPKAFFQKRKIGKGKVLKSFIDIIIDNYDNSKNILTTENDYDDEFSFNQIDANLGVDDNLVLTSAKNILNFIEKYSKSDISTTSLIEPVSRHLHNAILQNPNLLQDDLDGFVDIPFVYIHQILSAYISLMRTDKISDIKFLLSFISNIIRRSDLWINKKKNKSLNYELWTVNDISEFVSQCYVKYSKNISLLDYDDLKKIVINIYENLNNEEDQTQGYVSYMLNSETGKCFESLIHIYFLYMSINNGIPDNDIKGIFINEITSKQNQTFFTAFGAYFPGFYYKDKDFAISVYPKTLGEKAKRIKNAVLDGYLYTPYKTMTKEYYEFLRERRFFDDIINDVAENKNWCSLIARISCGSYIENLESLDDTDSLLLKIIETSQITYIISIINYFFNYNKKYSKAILAEDKVCKIEKLWSKICNQIRPFKNNPEYNNCIIELLKFLSSIPNIDEVIMENIKFSIRWIPQYSVEYYILDVFLRLYSYESNRIYVEEIIELFSNEKVFFYDYDKKLTNLFKEIYKINSGEAIKLCNLYIRGGESKYIDLLTEFKNGINGGE